MRLVIALLTACWLSPLLAQPAADSSQPQPEETAQSQPAAPAKADTPAAKDQAAAAKAKPAGDPSDYQASEQISEDLSVSFPADI